MTRRAVVTGIGVVAPSGIGADMHWKSTLSGENHIGRIQAFDPSPYTTTLAGEVAGFRVDDHVEGRLAVQTDRWTWMSLAATVEALDDAGLDLGTLDPYSVGVVLAAGSGGNIFGQGELQRLWDGPRRAVGAYQSVAWFYAASVGQTAIKHQIKGPSTVLVSEAAGGLESLAQAVRSIRRGADVIVAGGTEAPIGPYAMVCQQSSERLSTSTDPDTAYRPFDSDAAGYVPGEGGAILLVEALEHARDRGAHIYGEVVSWGSTHDGAPTRRATTVPHEHYARAMNLALRRAELSPRDVGVFFADASAVPAEDRAEAAALRSVFGARQVPVSSPKPRIGRLGQGGSALDVATALLSMDQDVIPAFGEVPNPHALDQLDLVESQRPGPLTTAVVGARGFGGFNSTLVLQKVFDQEGRS